MKLTLQKTELVKGLEGIKPKIIQIKAPKHNKYCNTLLFRYINPTLNNLL